MRSTHFCDGDSTSRSEPRQTGPDVDVAIVGAGPYGLSLAAHLADRGVEHRIFGPPMEAWRSMSAGMHLKSLGFATNIFTPDDHLTLPQFCRARGEEDNEPIPIATFADYGMTVQRHVAPQLEEVKVANIREERGLFSLTLQTGESVRARRVVIAIGLTYFDRIPTPFDRLPPDLVCHTSQRGDFGGLEGRDVTVIGAGQSALQAAALLHEHEAEVRLVARRSVHWGSRARPEAERSLFERVRIPVTVLGHGRDNWVLEHVPSLQHHLSDERRLRFVHTHLGPGGAWWLRDRVEGTLSIETDTNVVEAVAEGNKVRLTLVQSGEARELLTEFVVVGTGYDVNVDRIGFIEPRLAGRIRRLERAPLLSRFFESSVSGLYFVGPSSAASFGPLFRFVAGAQYTVAHVARHLAPRRLGALRVRN